METSVGNISSFEASISTAGESELGEISEASWDSPPFAGGMSAVSSKVMVTVQSPSSPSGNSLPSILFKETYMALVSINCVFKINVPPSEGINSKLISD